MLFICSRMIDHVYIPKIEKYLEVIIEITRFEKIWEEIRFGTLKELALHRRENIFYSLKQ